MHSAAIIVANVFYSMFTDVFNRVTILTFLNVLKFFVERFFTSVELTLIAYNWSKAVYVWETVGVLTVQGDGPPLL